MNDLSRAETHYMLPWKLETTPSPEEASLKDPWEIPEYNYRPAPDSIGAEMVADQLASDERQMNSGERRAPPAATYVAGDWVPEDGRSRYVAAGQWDFAGNFGYLFKVWDRKLERFRMLKVFQPKYTMDQGLEIEAKTIARMDEDRRVVRADTFFKHHVPEPVLRRMMPDASPQSLAGWMTTPMLIEEYVDPAEYQTIQSRLVQHGLFTATQTADVVTDIAGAVDRMVEEGFLHRDLNPENIFVDSTNRIKIADFGIALWYIPRNVPPLTNVNPHYASPERISGGEVALPSEVFSLGIMAYEMLTGVNPFNETGAPIDTIERDWDIIHAIEQNRYVPLVSHPERATLLTTQGKDISHLDEVFRRAFAPTPSDRYQTASQFASELRQAISSATSNPI